MQKLSLFAILLFIILLWLGNSGLVYHYFLSQYASPDLPSGAVHHKTSPCPAESLVSPGDEPDSEPTRAIKSSPESHNPYAKKDSDKYFKDEQELLYESGMRRFDDGNYKEAHRRFTSLIQKYPDYDMGYVGLSRVYCRTQKYKEAEETAKKAIEINPESFSAYFCLENLYNDTRVARYRDAEVVCKKLLELRPDDFDANFSLAETYEHLGDHKSCLFYLEKAARCHVPPDQVNNLTVAVDSLLYYGKMDLVKDLLTRLKAKYPNSSRVNFSWGVLYSRNDELQKAKKCFRRALALDPDFQKTYIELSLLYYQGGDYKRALSVLEEGAGRSPEFEEEDLEIQADMARIYIALENRKKAESIIASLPGKAGEEYGVDMAFALAIQGDLYMELKETRKARASFLEALKSNPGQPEALLGMAGIMIDKKSAAADTYLNRIEKIIPSEGPDLILALGELYCRKGDYKKTRELADQLFKQNDDSGPGYYLLAKLSLAGSDYRNFTINIKKAIKARPDLLRNIKRNKVEYAIMVRHGGIDK